MLQIVHKMDSKYRRSCWLPGNWSEERTWAHDSRNRSNYSLSIRYSQFHSRVNTFKTTADQLIRKLSDFLISCPRIYILSDDQSPQTLYTGW